MSRIQLLEQLMYERPWLDVMANDDFILAKAKSLPGKHDITSLRQAADLLGLKPNGDLLLAQAYADAWRKFTEKHPEYVGPGCAGNQRLVFNRLNDGEQNPTCEIFEEIAQRKTILPDGREGVSILSESTAHVNAQTEQAHRKQMILEISEGKSTYSARDQFGVLRVYQSADLDTEDTATLTKIHQIVQGQRNLQSLPPQQRREAIKQITKDNQPPTAVKIKNPLPAKYTCTVPSPHGYVVGQEVVLDTPVSFAKLGKEDQKILWIRHGSDALDALLRPGKA